jgi:histidinol-phosphatase (PHP family)
VSLRAPVLADYHMHTPRCGHAVGAPREYVQQSIRAGLREICFTDHQPLLRGRDPGLTMAVEELPDYIAEVMALRDEFRGRIVIKLGLEADYFPDLVGETGALLGSQDWDLVLGSVHFQDGWGFDDPRKLAEWEGRDVDAVYRRYFEDLRAAAHTGLFDVMAHPDLVKKFGHRAAYVLQGEYAKTAEAFAVAKVAVEVNTAGLRKPVTEIYPHAELLRACARFGVPATVGADAHDPGEVGQDFEKARTLLKQCGYTHTVVYEKRKIVERLPLG